ncbi:MAG: hypothetical protein EBU90_04815 [Proteobacteria bacterium]|nr:hypothetical protein [Pseudomonadota bacterium]NBP13760.1 hypothetical protein [bacterium]
MFSNTIYSTRNRVSDLICDNIISPVTNIISPVTNIISPVTNIISPVANYTSLPDPEPLAPSVKDDASSHQNNTSNYYFAHLEFANQTYWQHFRASMGYSWRSFASSFYFFVHAFWPDIFQHHGSDRVVALSDELIDKYEQRIKAIAEKYATN